MRAAHCCAFSIPIGALHLSFWCNLTTRSPLDLGRALAPKLESQNSLRLDAEVAGDALPFSVQVHPSIGEPTAALPRFALIDPFLVVRAGYNRGVPIGVNYHVARLQYLGMVGLVRHGGDTLRLVVKRAFGHRHDEIVRQQELYGRRVIIQLGPIP